VRGEIYGCGGVYVCVVKVGVEVVKIVGRLFETVGKIYLRLTFVGRSTFSWPGSPSVVFW
jgi:hypothetical protein